MKMQNKLKFLCMNEHIVDAIKIKKTTYFQASEYSTDLRVRYVEN